MSIEAVLFDLDGTLQDSERLGTVAYRFGIREVLDISLDEQEESYLIGKPFLALREVLPAVSDEQFDKVVNKTLEYYRKHNSKIELYDGILEVIKNIHLLGLQLGIVTAKLRENALSELKNNHIFEYFTLVYAKEDCRKFKPDPSPLLEMALELGVTPNECIYIGDQASDIQASRSAGMISCGAIWGTGRKAILDKEQPDYLLDSVGQLYNLVLELDDKESLTSGSTLP
jgi:pyrophosphatase PpaX